MDAVLNEIGLREAKNGFSALTARVNQTGMPVTVLKNGRPWVVIAPADAEAERRHERLECLRLLTREIDSFEDEPAWEAGVSDRDLLDEERVRRFG